MSLQPATLLPCNTQPVMPVRFGYEARMQPDPLLPTTVSNRLGRSCLPALGVPLMAQTIELSPITWLREEFAGAHIIALFVRWFRRGRGGEFFEARIIPERIEHWIEPERCRSERHAHSIENSFCKAAIDTSSIAN